MVEGYYKEYLKNTLKVCDAEYPPVTATPRHPPLGKEGNAPTEIVR